MTVSAEKPLLGLRHVAQLDRLGVIGLRVASHGPRAPGGRGWRPRGGRHAGTIGRSLLAGIPGSLTLTRRPWCCRAPGWRGRSAGRPATMIAASTAVGAVGHRHRAGPVVVHVARAPPTPATARRAARDPTTGTPRSRACCPTATLQKPISGCSPRHARTSSSRAALLVSYAPMPGSGRPTDDAEMKTMRPPRLGERRKGGPGHQRRSEHVGLEHGPPPLGVGVDQAHQRVDGGGVDDDVEAAELRTALADDAVALVGIAARRTPRWSHASPGLRRGVGQLVGPAGGEHDAGTGPQPPAARLPGRSPTTRPRRARVHPAGPWVPPFGSPRYRAMLSVHPRSCHGRARELANSWVPRQYRDPLLHPRPRRVPDRGGPDHHDI